MLDLLIVNNNGRIYTRDLNGKWHITFDRYLFDGEVPKETYKDGWYEIAKVPEVIMYREDDKKTNERWELLEQYQETNLTTIVYKTQQKISKMMMDLLGTCYGFKYDILPGEYKPVEFKIREIVTVDSEFNISRKDGNIQHYYIDQIETHRDLLYTKKCFLSKEDSFAVIMDYFERNIDTKVCEATYYKHSHCIVVRKKIQYHSPVEYILQERRKRGTGYKTIKKVKNHEPQEIFRLEEKDLFSFKGENEDDLMANIQEYCKPLVDIFNTPAMICSHCEGMGYSLMKVGVDGKQEAFKQNHNRISLF